MNTYCHFLRPIFCRTITLFFTLCFSYSIQAQEFLTGLKTNTQINKESQKQKQITPFYKSKAKFEESPLLLPFFEDFSNYTGYPNENIFIDKQAFVNNTFPVFPPTIGVATLDALNEFGEIYPHLNSSSQGADTLTSRYIRLDSLFRDDLVKKITLADSLYFSFYYQPGGGGIIGAGVEEYMGNQPNEKDSLVLEFGYIDDEDTTFTTVWEHVWSTPGFSISEWTSKNPLEYFKQVLIPITNENYLSKTFQFRFRNYASLEPQLGMTGWEGNVDQWHIDYIRLDVNRNYKDWFTNDQAFVCPTTSFLEKYQAMPWKQFHQADMKKNFANFLSNLDEARRSVTYKYFITKNGNLVYEHPITSAREIYPYYSHGLQTDDDQLPIKDRQAAPAIPYLPTLTDTATYIITHIFQNSGGEDFCTANDTCAFLQQFHNYYAYDDGTAEYGYCLNNQFNLAYLAMKFSLRIPDSLSGVRMWFNHTKDSANMNANFSIIVWSDNNGQPGNKLYTFEGNQPQFAEQFLDFVEYQFDKKVLVSGTIWIGFEQYGNVQLNIGFDQQNDSRAFFKYNTRGIWETSAFKGTPMLRPVFGNLQESTSPGSVSPKTMVGPNPATEKITITNYELQIKNIEIYDIMGKKQKTESNTLNGGNENEVRISHLSNGIYFIKVLLENNTFETMKLIKY